MAILTAEQAAQQLNVSEDSAAFRALVDAVNAYVRRYCHREFDYALYTEWHDVDASNACELWVSEPPIASVSALYDDADTSTNTTRSNRAIAVATDIEVYSTEGRIRLSNNESAFTKGVRTAKVVYYGGYREQDMPGDLIYAAGWIVQAWWEGSDALTRQNQSIDGAWITWRDGEIPPQAKMILDGYKRVFV